MSHPCFWEKSTLKNTAWKSRSLIGFWQFWQLLSTYVQPKVLMNQWQKNVFICDTNLAETKSEWVPCWHSKFITTCHFILSVFHSWFFISEFISQSFTCLTDIKVNQSAQWHTLFDTISVFKRWRSKIVDRINSETKIINKVVWNM